MSAIAGYGKYRSKRGWTESEDAFLLSAVRKHGKKWRLVADEVPGRSAKQARERYLHHLDPDVIKEYVFTPQDVAVIRREVSQAKASGSSIPWVAIAAEISSLIDQRFRIGELPRGGHVTDGLVKNYYHSKIKSGQVFELSEAGSAEQPRKRKRGDSIAVPSLCSEAQSLAAFDSELEPEAKRSRPLDEKEEPPIDWEELWIGLAQPANEYWEQLEPCDPADPTLSILGARIFDF